MFFKALIYVASATLTFGVITPALAQYSPYQGTYNDYNSGSTIRINGYGNGYGSVNGYNPRTGRSVYGTYDPNGATLYDNSGGSLRYNRGYNPPTIQEPQIQLPSSSTYYDNRGLSCIGNYCSR